MIDTSDLKDLIALANTVAANHPDAPETHCIELVKLTERLADEIGLDIDSQMVAWESCLEDEDDG